MISVIVPVYNRMELLKRALVSILAQTYKDVEVIVVDDGSGERFKIEDLRFKINVLVKLIRQENRGAPAARNRGLAEAKGEYVIFWDADVVAVPQMLEKLKNALDRHSQASYVYSNFQFSIFNFQSIFNFLIFKKQISSGVYDFERLKKCNYIHTTSLIRRKDVVRWDESLKKFQDWDLWLTMAEMGKIGVWVDEYLFTVLGGGTMSKWLPRFAYRALWKWLPFVRGRVESYEKTRDVVLNKHHTFNLLNTR